MLIIHNTQLSNNNNNNRYINILNNYQYKSNVQILFSYFKSPEADRYQIM